MPNQIQTGVVAVVEGQQSYSVEFTRPFSAVPEFIDPEYQSGGGENNTATLARDSITPLGFTAWLKGVPTGNSLGAYINWQAAGPLAAS